MAEITITLQKESVYNEVGKITDYAASKMAEPSDDARDRIVMGDEDMEDLSRLWDECTLAVVEKLKGMVRETSENELTLAVGPGFNTNLTNDVTGLIQLYYVYYIAGSWFCFVSKEESASYLTQAATYLSAAERLLLSRQRPVKPANKRVS